MSNREKPTFLRETESGRGNNLQGIFRFSWQSCRLVAHLLINHDFISMLEITLLTAIRKEALSNEQHTFGHVINVT